MNNITIIPIKNLPEFKPEHDLVNEIIKSFDHNNVVIENDDVIVITQKIISKSENRLIDIEDKDIEELIKKESLEILRKRGDTVIARTIVESGLYAIVFIVIIIGTFLIRQKIVLHDISLLIMTYIALVIFSLGLGLFL